MALNNTDSNRDIFTVSRLNRKVRELLENRFPSIRVQGEISNLVRPASGHIYFSMKDQNAQVRCAMFKSRTLRLRFNPENGMEVLARANVGLYEGRGEYQLIIESLEPAGDGALLRAFELLKAKLAKAGLFDQQHKVGLPAFPQKIGVITSSSGAAIRDICSVLSRRYRLAEIILYPTLIQGQEAAAQIVRAISLADGRNECDVIILARGGGSLEDLWVFNEEVVARAIYDCNLPIVSGIGHEIDFTIADFVADKRGATPSVAAELVSPDIAQLSQTIAAFERQLQKHVQQLLVLARHRMDNLVGRLRDPERQIREMNQRVDECYLRLIHVMRLKIAQGNADLLALSGRLKNINPIILLGQYKNKADLYKHRLCQQVLMQLEQTRQKLNYLNRSLHAVSPLATLDRGYAIVTNRRTNNIVRRAKSVQTGDQISTRVAQGEIISLVDAVKD